MSEPDGKGAPPGKAELAVAFARKLRARAKLEKGLPADKAFFDDLSGGEEAGTSAEKDGRS